jgi:hypothetical protein
MVNGRAFALGAIGGAGVSVQLAHAGHAGAWTGSATEEAPQSGIVNGNRSPAAWRTAGSAASTAGILGTARWACGNPVVRQGGRS